MKIYAVQESYDNGESYEDHYWYDNRTVVLCATEQKARDYISGIELPNANVKKGYVLKTMKPIEIVETWVEGEPYSDYPTECIRQFYCERAFSDAIEQKWYTIKETEVLE